LTARDHKMRYREFMPRMWGHLARTLKNPALSDARAFVEEVARPYLEKAA
jgi:aminoglycoside/choline kinase family phosphotransferase